MTKYFIYLATCSGCSLCKVCLSAARSQSAGGARPVSDSLIPMDYIKQKCFWSDFICPHFKVHNAILIVPIYIHNFGTHNPQKLNE